MNTGRVIATILTILGIMVGLTGAVPSVQAEEELNGNKIELIGGYPWLPGQTKTLKLTVWVDPTYPTQFVSEQVYATCEISGLPTSFSSEVNAVRAEWSWQVTLTEQARYCWILITYRMTTWGLTETARLEFLEAQADVEVVLSADDQMIVGQPSQFRVGIGNYGPDKVIVNVRIYLPMVGEGQVVSAESELVADDYASFSAPIIPQKPGIYKLKALITLHDAMDPDLVEPEIQVTVLREVHEAIHYYLPLMVR